MHRRHTQRSIRRSAYRENDGFVELIQRVCRDRNRRRARGPTGGNRDRAGSNRIVRARRRTGHRERHRDTLSRRCRQLRRHRHRTSLANRRLACRCPHNRGRRVIIRDGRRVHRRRTERRIRWRTYRENDGFIELIQRICRDGDRRRARGRTGSDRDRAGSNRAVCSRRRTGHRKRHRHALT